MFAQKLGKMNPIWRSFFRKWVETTNSNRSRTPSKKITKKGCNSRNGIKNKHICFIRSLEGSGKGLNLESLGMGLERSILFDPGGVWILITCSLNTIVRRVKTPYKWPKIHGFSWGESSPYLQGWNQITPVFQRGPHLVSHHGWNFHGRLQSRETVRRVIVGLGPGGSVVWDWGSVR